MDRQPRSRRYVSRRTLWVLRPLFRYSASREAYVLRLVGSSRGPVLKVRSKLDELPHTPPAPAVPTPPVRAKRFERERAARNGDRAPAPARYGGD